MEGLAMKTDFRTKDNGLNSYERNIKEDDHSAQVISNNSNPGEWLDAQSVRYRDYYAVRRLLKWLRGEVVRSAELAVAKDAVTFRLLRSRLLNLFGKAWGAEKMLNDIYR